VVVFVTGLGRHALRFALFESQSLHDGWKIWRELQSLGFNGRRTKWTCMGMVFACRPSITGLVFHVGWYYQLLSGILKVLFHVGWYYQLLSGILKVQTAEYSLHFFIIIIINFLFIFNSSSYLKYLFKYVIL
jgi:hypothetical protein